MKAVGKSIEFNQQWEKVNSKIGKLLTEAYNDTSTNEDWVNACVAVKEQIERLEVWGCHKKRDTEVLTEFVNDTKGLYYPLV